ncbi:MAG: hypothetical protein Q8R24_01775 [Legionellaceae bacterium]|nr:hypothetical protein [Legionellaceae bacterium]
MGAVTFSIDPRLIAALNNHLAFDVFVETGTFRGETIDIIMSHFNRIYSVELSPHYYENAVRKFADDPNITIVNADSATALKAILPEIQDRPAMFWLDAHWCVADATAGEMSQCPLLAELDAIKQLNDQSMIIIDDARLFLATPQAPHEISNWPTLDAITRALFRLSSRHQICVVNDCILFFPQAIEEQIKQFSYQHGVDWLDLLNRCRDSEALLIKVSQENDMLHNLGFWRRIRGLFGYSWRVLNARFRTPNMISVSE